MPKTANAATESPFPQTFAPVLKALVVDREEPTRQLIAEALQRHGYDICECATEEEARRNYHEHALVVTSIGATADQPQSTSLINWLRLNAGKRQPYILAIGVQMNDEGFPPSNADFAYNAILPSPIDPAKLDAQALQVQQIMGAGKPAPLAKSTAALDAEEELVLPPHRSATSLPLPESAPTNWNAEVARAKIPPPKTSAALPGLKPLDQESPFKLATSLPASEESKPAAKPSPFSTFEKANEPVKKEATIKVPMGFKPAAPAAAPAEPVAARAETGPPGADCPPESNQATSENVLEVAPSGRAQTQPHHLHILIENAPLAMAMFDKDMNYLVANKLWLKQFDLLNTSLVGRNHFDVFPGLHDSWRKIYSQCLAGSGQIEHCRDDVIARADGSHDWVDWEVRPWRLASREVAGLIITCEIVTERKANETALLFDRQLTYSLLESKSAPILIVDLEGNILRSSQAARELGSAPELDAEGKNTASHGSPYWDIHTPAGYREETRRQFNNDITALNSEGVAGLPSHRREIIHDTQGNHLSYLWSLSPYYDENGMITGIVRIGVPAPETEGDPMARDLATEIQSGQAPSNGANLSTQSGIPTAYQHAMVWESDAKGSMTYLGEAWHRFTGMPVSKQLGTGWMAAVHQDDRKQAAATIVSSLRKAAPIEVEFRFKAANGEYRWILLQGTPQIKIAKQRDAGDDQAQKTIKELTGYTGCCTDITTFVHKADEKVQQETQAADERARKAIGEAKTIIETVTQKAAVQTAPADNPEAITRIKPNLALPPLAPLGSMKPTSTTRPEPDIEVQKAAQELERKQQADFQELTALKERCRLLEGIPNHVPFGVVLLDDEGAQLYSNPQMETILGRKLEDHGQFEDWLGACAPDPECAAEIIQQWRDYVWRRQLTKTFSLSNTKGFLKEIEFRPRLLRDGTLILAIVDVTESKRSEEALRASEAKFRTLFQDSGVGIALVESAGQVYDVNTSLVKLLGFSVREFRQLDINDLIVREDCHLIPRLLNELRTTAARSGRTNLRMLTKHGEQVSVRINLCQIHKPDGELLYNALFINETQAAPQPMAVEESEIASTPTPFSEIPVPTAKNAVSARPAATDSRQTGQLDRTWRSLVFASLDEALLVTDAEFQIVEANPAARKLFGFDAEAMQNLPLARLFQPDDPEKFHHEIAIALQKHRSWSSRCQFVDSSGGALDCFVNLSPLCESADSANAPERLLCITTLPNDETPGAESDPAFGLDPSACAPPAAQPESHHSLKNNLQVINSLLNLQLGQLGDGASDQVARQSLLACQKRIRCISLVHQRLLSVATAEHPDYVDFAGCLRDITAEHLKSYGENDANGRIRLSLPFQALNPDLKLDLRTAVPLLLIANELISNSIRYAFPGEDDRGTITVNLEFLTTDADDGKLRGELTVSDDGVGIDPGIDVRNSKGLGLQLVHALAAQIDGAVEYEDFLETVFKIGFSPLDGPK